MTAAGDFPSPKLSSRTARQPVEALMFALRTSPPPGTFDPPGGGVANNRFAREFTDLSSIDLCTEAEDPPRYDAPTITESIDSEQEGIGPQLAKAVSLILAGSFTLVVASLVLLATRPMGLQLPSAFFALPQPPVPWEQQTSTSARELLECHELSALTSDRLRAADPALTRVLGKEGLHKEVVASYHAVASKDAQQLDALLLSPAQRNGVLEVLRHMSDNPRLQIVGRFLAHAVREAAHVSRGERGVAAQVLLRRLRPRFSLMRRLRNEVIPPMLRQQASSRPAASNFNSQQDELRLAELLHDRWHSSISPLQGNDDASGVVVPRQLGADNVPGIGFGDSAGKFMESIRGCAAEASGAVNTCQADNAAALRGLDRAITSPSSDSADQEQVAKSDACYAMVQTINAMDAVMRSLSEILQHLAKMQGNLEQSSDGAMAQHAVDVIFKDVTEVEGSLANTKVNFQTELNQVKPLVRLTNDMSSLKQTRTALVQVMNQTNMIQARMVSALQEWRSLYDAYNGQGNLLNTVKVYASSIYMQLQDRFHVSLPDFSIATSVLHSCLDDTDGFIDSLMCRLTFARMCLELLLGMNVEVPSRDSRDVLGKSDEDKEDGPADTGWVTSFDWSGINRGS